MEPTKIVAIRIELEFVHTPESSDTFLKGLNLIRDHISD